MSSRSKKQSDRAARDAALAGQPVLVDPAAIYASANLRERRDRQQKHDQAQREMRAARRSAGPSATERALMTATADTYAGTRYDWHLDFVRLHQARTVDMRGTPAMDPRLLNRLSTAERAAARERHALALAALEQHAPAQAWAYRLAFVPPLGGTPDAIEEDVAAVTDAALSTVRHRLWAAVRAVLAACDGIVPEVVADYATARQGAIRKAEREERARRWKAVQRGQVGAGDIRQ